MPTPEYLLEFTPQERRVADAARARLIHTLEVIAQCHGVYEPWAPSPDGKGLMKPQVEVLNG
jgi:hypothetical protein